MPYNAFQFVHRGSGGKKYCTYFGFPKQPYTGFLSHLSLYQKNKLFLLRDRNQYSGTDSVEMN
jgi:hypothetical protein